MNTSGWRSLMTNHALLLTATFWLLGTLSAFVLPSDMGLPFGERPLLDGAPLAAELGIVWGGLLVALILVGVTYLITRNRKPVDFANRTSSLRVTRFEVLMLVIYGVLVQLFGLALGMIIDGHPISLHMHGTLYGTDHPVTPGYALLWAGYNFTFYALVPYILFRLRGYSNEQLGLNSNNRFNDTVLIVVIVLLESAVEFGTVSTALFSLEPSQLLLGIPASLLLNLFGTVLPVMIFLYAILLPRVLQLTGSVLTTVIIGGFAYAAVHVFDSWANYDSLASTLLSLAFVGMQYFGPGVVKSVLTLRTGNAWVHAIGYHALAPHVTLDTPNIVNVFNIR